mmetsp:Transcript_4728/g.10405  ORF Transcript_4728/g.10405 Transcript_4728/m.10405 type:complete len:437 (+) Transcript_4728:1807-3117(+)
MDQVVEIGNGHGKIKDPDRVNRSVRIDEFLGLVPSLLGQVPKKVGGSTVLAGDQWSGGAVGQRPVHQVHAPRQAPDRFALVQFSAVAPHVERLQDLVVSLLVAVDVVGVATAGHKLRRHQRQCGRQRVRHGDPVGATGLQQPRGAVLRKRSKGQDGGSLVAGRVVPTGGIAGNGGEGGRQGIVSVGAKIKIVRQNDGSLGFLEGLSGNVRHGVRAEPFRLNVLEAVVSSQDGFLHRGRDGLLGGGKTESTVVVVVVAGHHRHPVGFVVIGRQCQYLVRQLAGTGLIGNGVVEGQEQCGARGIGLRPMKLEFPERRGVRFDVAPGAPVVQVAQKGRPPAGFEFAGTASDVDQLQHVAGFVRSAVVAIVIVVAAIDIGHKRARVVVSLADHSEQVDALVGFPAALDPGPQQGMGLHGFGHGVFQGLRAGNGTAIGAAG